MGCDVGCGVCTGFNVGGSVFIGCDVGGGEDVDSSVVVN